MKRLIALITALMMLILPMSSMAEGNMLTTEAALGHLFQKLGAVLSGEDNGLQVTLFDPEGQGYSAGFGSTGNGMSVNYNQHNLGLLLDGVNAYLTSNGVTSSVSMEALLKAIETASNNGQSVPSVTEEEFNFLMTLGNDFLSSLLSSKSITWNLTSSVLNLHVDLDGLLVHLDAMIPELLAKHRASFEAVLTKYAPYIVGQAITVDQLIAEWANLGLKDMKTGVVLDAFGFRTSTGLSLITSCMNWNFQAAVTSSGLSFVVTAPDGKAYPFDTADIMTVASILSTVPNGITEEAFKFEQTSDETQRYAPVTTHITADFGLIERDLLATLVQAIKANELPLNTLCSKYQPWIDLMFSQVTVSTEGEVVNVPAPQITASWLAEHAAQLSLLPHIKGELTAVYNPRTDSIDVEGNLDALLFDAHILNGTNTQTSIDASIRVPDARNPFVLSLTGVIDRYGLPTFTLSCNQDIGGFKSITYNQARVYRSGRATVVTSITTDTDLIRLTADSGRYGRNLTLKLGTFELDFAQNFSSYNGMPAISLHVFCTDAYYLDMNVTSTGMELDSTIGGFSFSQTRSVVRLEGYLNIRSIPSSVALMYDTENNLATLSITPASGGNMHFTYRTGRLNILAEDSILVIADAHAGSPTKNITVASFDGQTVATLVSEIFDGEDITFTLYLGEDLEGECWMLKFDFGAAGQPIPTGAVAVTAEEFMAKLQAAFDPSAVPAPIEASDEADAETPELPDFSQLSDFDGLDDEFIGQ